LSTFRSALYNGFGAAIDVVARLWRPFGIGFFASPPRLFRHEQPRCIPDAAEARIAIVR
jgi:hypothetical protein